MTLAQVGSSGSKPPQAPGSWASQMARLALSLRARSAAVASIRAAGGGGEGPGRQASLVCSAQTARLGIQQPAKLGEQLRLWCEVSLHVEVPCWPGTRPEGQQQQQQDSLR